MKLAKTVFVSIVIFIASYFLVLDLNVSSLKDLILISYIDLFVSFNDVLLSFAIIAQILILSGFVIHLYLQLKSKIQFPSIYLSLIFSLFQIIGRNYYLSFTFSHLLENSGLLLLNLVSSSLFFYIILESIISRFQHPIRNNLSMQPRYIFLLSLFVILITGLPYIFFFYPGTVHWDGLAQLNQFFGIRFWDNHYPAISTALFGLFMNFGRSVMDDNFGIFLYISLQYVVNSLVFAYATTYVAIKTKNRAIYLFTLLFFAVYPIWPMNAITYVKDTYYYLFMLLLVIQISKYSDKPVKNNLVFSIGVFSSCFGLWVFRNDGFYLIVLTLLFMMFWTHQQTLKKWLFSLLLFFVVLNSLYYSWLLPSVNILEGSPREMLSVPLQQIARYCKYKQDISSTLYTPIFDELFFITCSELGKSYVPETSDYVKMHFLYNPTTEQLQLLDRLWFDLLLARPDIFVDAFLENYYGYFYPIRQEYKDGIAWFSIQSSSFVNTGDFNLFLLDHRANGRTWIENSINTLRNLPLINLIFNVGTYLWALMIAIVVLIRKKQTSQLIVFIPLIITSLITFLSPVNAYVRYMLPVMVCLPIIISHLVTRSDNQLSDH